MKYLAAWLLVVATSATASAHFILKAPAAYSKQDGTGLPEKSAPCGQSDPGNPIVATGAETTFAAGDTISITIEEAIFHPGHYRVSVAQNEAALPADPAVTMNGDLCATAAIETTPVLPVVADNLLVHTSAFSMVDNTVQVTLPAGLTCAHCLLQVVEFMSDHPLNNPGGCFYHHCARVSITDNGVDAPPAAPDVTPVAPAPGGCCDVRSGTPNLALIVIVGALMRRRARTSRRSDRCRR